MGATNRNRPTPRFIFASNADPSRRRPKAASARTSSTGCNPILSAFRRSGSGWTILPSLVDHFFDKACNSLGKKRPSIPKELLTLLKSYAFPGNIRELEGMVVDAVVRHKSRMLSLVSFRQAMSRPIEDSPGTATATTDERNPFEEAQMLPTIRQATVSLIGSDSPLRRGNREAAARMLGLSRSALSKRLNRNP